jgi:hypothetical protein
LSDFLGRVGLSVNQSGHQGDGFRTKVLAP